MKKKIMIASVAVLAAAVYWAIAQTTPAPLATIFPTGAALYLEAKDFGALVADWDGSAEKAAWLKSANHDVFSQSALFQKLGQAQTDFATAAGVPPDYALLKSIAGMNSALAIYNIGALQFLYVTHLPSARAMNTNLWKARGSYQSRKAGGVDFYVKEDTATKRVAAFAYVGDLLLLGTREDLVAGALELLAPGGAGRPSLASEQWFTDATAAGGAAGELRLVHNIARLVQAPQFRSHWVQRNSAALREFAGGVVDLERASGEMRERRVLVRVNASAAISDESATGQLLAAVPDDAGFYRATLLERESGAAKALQSMEEKIFAATAPPKPREDFAPVIPGETESGNERDLETRIDEPPLTDDRAATAFATLAEKLAGTPAQAMLEVGGTRVDADRVFVGSQSAVALLANSNWDADAMRGAIATAVGSLWSNGGQGAGWRAGANGSQELDGLGRIAMAIDGRWLVIGNSPDLVNAIFARRNRAAVAGSVYAAGWRHARELPNFERMMRLIDFPQGNTGGAPNQGREPMFYSENIASFGRVLQRVQSAVINVHDAGSMLRENVVYRLAP